MFSVFIMFSERRHQPKTMLDILSGHVGVVLDNMYETDTDKNNEEQTPTKLKDHVPPKIEIQTIKLNRKQREIQL